MLMFGASAPNAPQPYQLTFILQSPNVQMNICANPHSRMAANVKNFRKGYSDVHVFPRRTASCAGLNAPTIKGQMFE
jgi:hypothetical protein